jgi:hypothetical protein
MDLPDSHTAAEHNDGKFVNATIEFWIAKQLQFYYTLKSLLFSKNEL